MTEPPNKGYAVFNPNSKPVKDLPIIYGFNNGGGSGWFHAQLIAEDGTGLGSHMCSSEYYMLRDLGILTGSRPAYHKIFQEHYSGGYRMEFVSAADVRDHKGIAAAYAKNQEQAAADKENDK